MANKEIRSFSDLTSEERSYLAMHAQYAASSEVDPRKYVTGELEAVPGVGLVHKLGPDWATRHERQERWLKVAEALERSDPPASPIQIHISPK